MDPRSTSEKSTWSYRSYAPRDTACMTAEGSRAARDSARSVDAAHWCIILTTTGARPSLFDSSNALYSSSAQPRTVSSLAACSVSWWNVSPSSSHSSISSAVRGKYCCTTSVKSAASFLPTAQNCLRVAPTSPAICSSCCLSSLALPAGINSDEEDPRYPGHLITAYIAARTRLCLSRTHASALAPSLGPPKPRDTSPHSSSRYEMSTPDAANAQQCTSCTLCTILSSFRPGWTVDTGAPAPSQDRSIVTRNGHSACTRFDSSNVLASLGNPCTTIRLTHFVSSTTRSRTSGRSEPQSSTHHPTTASYIPAQRDSNAL
mmetsp:Transcript_1733/g.5771  ORF Transcript_1733/g.5771 Transcript_1733/m.5771 type:complete len:318 (-) Transcript_1733:25-978(-)